MLAYVYYTWVRAVPVRDIVQLHMSRAASEC
jgi:hypothetical protein